MRILRFALEAVVLVTLIASPAVAGADAGVVSDGGRPGKFVFGGSRPVTLSVPTSYDPRHPAPLLLVLHGYGSTGQQHVDYFGLAGLVEGHGVLLAAPDGTLDAQGNRFWDAARS